MSVDRMGTERARTTPSLIRVREAVSQLANGDAMRVEVRHEAPGAVTVLYYDRRVVVLEAELFVSGASWVEELVALAVRGECALVVLGAVHGSVQPLLDRGVYDVIDPNASAVRISLAVRNALEMLELKERAENRARWMRRFRDEAGTLIHTARALSQERDTDKLLGLILEKCRQIAGADAGSIYVVEGNDPQIEKRALRFKLSQNDSVSFPSAEFVMPVSMRSIAGAVTITRKLTALEDVYDLPPNSPFSFDRTYDQKVGYRTRSMLTVPLVSAEDSVIGVVQLINKKRDPRQRLNHPGDFDREVIAFDARSIELIASLASQAGVALENAILYGEIRHIFEGFVRASVQAIEQRDPTTSGHSMRVSEFSCGLAEAVDRTSEGPYRDAKFSRQDLRELEYASLLHDFGKIGVREEILLKAKKLYDWQIRLIRSRFDYLQRDAQAQMLERRIALMQHGAGVEELSELDDELARRLGTIEGYWDVVRESNEPSVMPQDARPRLDDIGRMRYRDPRGQEHAWLSLEELDSLRVARGSLTSDEINEIRSHVSHTFDFLSRIPWGKSFANVPIIAGCHHEKLNGHGYPRGLRGDAIPIGSRIMAIADIYDALTAHDRPYKKAIPVERALYILDLEVKDGGLDRELVRIFREAEVWKRVASAPQP